MVTAEIAVALPALVLVLTIALSAVSMVIDELRCVDAARAGARLLARGEDPGHVRSDISRQAPPAAEAVLAVDGDRVRVEVSAPPPRLLRVLGVTVGPHAVAHAMAEQPP